jgi:hypothetical protein
MDLAKNVISPSFPDLFAIHSSVTGHKPRILRFQCNFKPFKITYSNATMIEDCDKL